MEPLEKCSCRNGPNGIKEVRYPMSIIRQHHREGRLAERPMGILVPCHERERHGRGVEEELEMASKEGESPF